MLSASVAQGATAWSTGLEAGVVAFDTSANTRAPLIEVRLLLQRQIVNHLCMTVAYRGSWRDAGTQVVGVFSTAQRLQLGGEVFAQAWGVEWALELAAVPTLETYTLRGPGESTDTQVLFSLGAAVEGVVRLPITQRLQGTFRTGATLRRQNIDFVALAGVAWGF